MPRRITLKRDEPAIILQVMTASARSSSLGMILHLFIMIIWDMPFTTTS